MLNLSLTTVLLSLTVVACGDKGGPNTDEDTGALTTSTTMTPTGETGATEGTATTVDPSVGTDTGEPETTAPTTAGESTGPVGETAANGEACVSNGDCMSIACEKFRDLEDGVCVEPAAGGNTRVMGTLVDFITLAPIPSTEVRALEALTALQNPVDGAAILTATSDAEGKVDVTSTEPIGAAFGVVGIVQGGSYYPTATGLAAPLSGQMYGPMNGNRDIWAVPADKLTEWSGLLASDPEFMIADPMMAVLPLGERGGVVGFVRDRTNGVGVAGAKVVGADPMKPTEAIIRYLSEDGTAFNSDATASSGLFVLVNPGLAEVFAVEGTTSTGTGGSAKNAIFVLILTVD